MKRLLFAVLLALVIVIGSDAQNGSPHGIATTWSAPSPVGGSGTIQGYQVFRCNGTCTVSSSGWVAVSGVQAGTSFLDPASGLNVNTTYSYAVLTVDSLGNESAFSNVSTVAVGASFPSNPNAPVNNGSKVQ